MAPALLWLGGSHRSRGELEDGAQRQFLFPASLEVPACAGFSVSISKTVYPLSASLPGRPLIPR